MNWERSRFLSPSRWVSYHNTSNRHQAQMDLEQCLCHSRNLAHIHGRDLSTEPARTRWMYVSGGT